MRLLGVGYLAMWIVLAWIVRHPAQPSQDLTPPWEDALDFALEIGWFVIGCMIGFRLLAGERVSAWAWVLLVNFGAAVLVILLTKLAGARFGPGGPAWSSGQNLIALLLFYALAAVTVFLIIQENRA